ncbi:MAG: hypothetical protein H6936_08595 [Burkholderiales bacterium]|nr:hypothetical protein [Burkholderiales bacterium]
MYKKNGLFPDEFPLIVKDGKKLVCIEGNRRLAALKALNEPDIVPNYKNRIEKLDNPSITKIRVVIAPNKEDAIKHIANKHTSDYKRPWKPLRQAYFYKSQLDNGKSINNLKMEYPNQDIPKFIKMLEAHHFVKSIKYDDDVIAEKIHDERKFPITNLERIYETPYARKFLGFEFDENGYFIGKIGLAEFQKAFKRIAEDVAKGEVDSRKHNTAKAIKAYLDAFPKENKPNLTTSGKFSSKDAKEIKLLKNEVKSRYRQKESSRLFDVRQVPYNLASTSLKLVYDELKAININTFPNATHDLLRSFLEGILVKYLKETKQFENVQKDKKHNPKIDEMLNYLFSDKAKYPIHDENIRTAVEQMKTDYSKPYSVVRLHMMNHNENVASTRLDVLSVWGKMEGLVKILLDPPRETDD